MAFVEDLSVFFSEDGFAVSAIYTPAGGVAKTISVIFHDAYAVAQGLGDGGVGTSAPIATCKTSDVPSAARGDHLVIASVTYHVVEVRPDGTGVTVLVLSRD